MIVWHQPHEIGQWVCQRLGTRFNPEEATAIGLERNGSLVAGVMFDRFNGRSVCMHVVGLGGHWLNRGYLKACFGYAFNQLKVGKVLGLVDSENLQSRKFTEHLGFRLEATVTGVSRLGDLLIYSMTPDECRWR